MNYQTLSRVELEYEIEKRLPSFKESMRGDLGLEIFDLCEFLIHEAPIDGKDLSYEELEEENEKLADEISSLEIKIEELESKNDDLQVEKQELREVLKTRDQEEKEERDNISYLEDQILALENEKHDLGIDLETAETKIESLEETLKCLEEFADSLLDGENN